MRPLHVMIVAGEPSGDALGAELVRALKTLLGRRALRLEGIGGEALIGEGLDSLFPMDEIAVMGVSEVLPRLPAIQFRIAETASRAIHMRPDVVITIDSPDFSFRVARQVKRGAPSIPIVHYVAPQVWAWRSGRARRLRRYVDLLLALLPFEPAFFESHGAHCVFVGHPAVERRPPAGAGAAFRAEHGIGESDIVLAVLPGSRRSEVARLASPFLEAAARLQVANPSMRIVIPTLSTLVPVVEEAARRHGVAAIVVAGEARRRSAFAAADVALAASGTVTLELGAAGVPMVVGYRMNPVTAAIARRVLNVKYVNLMNLVLGEGVIPELLQHDCRPDRLADALQRLIADEGARENQLRAIEEALHRMGAADEPPARRAARAVLDFLEHRRPAAVA